MFKQNDTQTSRSLVGISKCPTGIRGLDEITQGGLPRGRPTLVCGSAGCGKTLMAMEFIVHGCRDFGEPGVYMTFEETADELTENVASLGFDIGSLVEDKQLVLDHVLVERSEIEETGDYGLEGLFVRLDSMIQEVGAKRVAIDSLETLFAALPNEAILRAELRRLFRWLKEKGVTAIITGEQGDESLTRHGLEEYISDCVIFLDHRVSNQIATRRVRVIKYRGSAHGTNEYPVMLDEEGLSVLPISSLGLDYPVRQDRISTGIPRLDTMLGGQGYYRGSSILVSGSAGTGKTSLAVAFANSICSQGERCLYVGFEEAPAQIIRNMTSIGYDLGQWVNQGLLRFHAVRSTVYGLEQHLVKIHKIVQDFQPAAVILDPVTNLDSIGNVDEITTMLTRVIDFLKNRGVTALFTSLTMGGSTLEGSDVNISSLMDTWLLLRGVETSGERNRLLFILKSRGMAHSNQVREFLLTDEGIQLKDVYVGPGAVLTGSARVMQEIQDTAQAAAQKQANARRQRELEQEQASIKAQMESLQFKNAALDDELQILKEGEATRREAAARERADLAVARRAD